MNKVLSITAIALAIGLSLSVQANDELVEGYVTDSQGQVYKNSFGECWRDRFAATTVKLPECGYVQPTAILECPSVITISNLHFEFDDSTVADLDKDRLLYARKLINTAVPKGCMEVGTIHIVGHTDSIGTEEYNSALSIRRANAVKNFLIEYGVTADFIIGGAGEFTPIADNSTKEGRAENRRVVIKLTK